MAVGGDLPAPSPEQPSEGRGCVSVSPLQRGGKRRSHKFCPDWALGADFSYSLCQPRGAVEGRRIQEKRRRGSDPLLQVGSGAPGWTHSEECDLRQTVLRFCGVSPRQSPPHWTARKGLERGTRAWGEGAVRRIGSQSTGAPIFQRRQTLQTQMGRLSRPCCREVTGPPVRAAVGGVPGPACALCPSVGRGRGGRPGSSGLLAREAREGAQPFPEKPRRAHGAPDLARSPQPAEPRLREKGLILPTEVTRCVRGKPPRAEAPPGPAARAPLTAEGRSPRPLPAPWPHECLLRPKVLGNTTPGLRGRTRSRLRPGSAGPVAGGRGRERARASRESRSAGVGAGGAPAAAGTLPAGRSGGRRRAEQRRVSRVAASGHSRQICAFRASGAEGRGVGGAGQ